MDNDHMEIIKENISKKSNQIETQKEQEYINILVVLKIIFAYLETRIPHS